MKVFHIFAILLACLSFQARAVGNIYHYSIEQALATDVVKAALDPGIKFYFGSQVAPELAEKSRPDSYWRSDSTASLGSVETKCMTAFAHALTVVQDIARTRGYDAIVDIHALGGDEKPVADDKGFDCKPGFRTTEIPLLVAFALTRSGAQLAEQARNDPAQQVLRQAEIKKRKATAKTLFFPLDSVLNSPEAKAILGLKIKLHWGALGAPAYVERFGPDSYSSETSVKDLGREGACKAAVLRILQSMVDDAVDEGYDAVINVRSFLNAQPSLDGEYECEINKWDADVTLLGSLVKLR